eukprot:CAMPEP_0197195308 /NCGR_PEP_ID=MMETSP1423-20130617/30847_1 /TAXON_ID=476441 /ORGANISM="Pseudo-nitzschia heimii, Strain UNC1101" /LENGTH=150 /DNA_ID=CAMNT_0042648905 /DNA_START=272 /DNA_END=721 /DNA_ORIENTATION=-
MVVSESPVSIEPRLELEGLGDSLESHPSTSKDAEILQLAKCMCESEFWFGTGNYKASMKRTRFFRTEVMKLIKEGGSLARSNALHMACKNGDLAIVNCILLMDPSCIEARDPLNRTPLMVAAQTAAAMCTIQIIPIRQPVVDLLLLAGAK